MKKITFLSLLIIGALSSCGIYTSVSVNVDRQADFSTYTTFAWLNDHVDTANTPYNNEVIRNNIRNYIGQEFAERGYMVDLENPDLLLQVAISNQKRERKYAYPAYPSPFYFRPYFYLSDYYYPYHWDFYYRYSETYCFSMGACEETIGYMEGSITLNVIDRKAGKLIWTGTAKGDIYDPGVINKNIHPAVKSIMKQFPVNKVNRKEKELAVSAGFELQ